MVVCYLARCGSEAEVVPVRQIDNSAVLLAQLARLDRVKQSRDDAAVAAALQVSHFILCHVLAVHGHVLCLLPCCVRCFIAPLPAALSALHL